MTTTFKVNVNGSFRQLQLGSTSYTELADKIKTAFSIPTEATIESSYVDEEGDRIVFDSDSELSTIVNRTKVIKLDVVVKSSPQQQPDEIKDSTGSTPQPSAGGPTNSSSTGAAPADPYKVFMETIQPGIERLTQELNSHPEVFGKIQDILNEIATKAQTNVEPLIKTFHDRYQSRFGEGDPMQPWARWAQSQPWAQGRSTPSSPNTGGFDAEPCRQQFRQAAESWGAGNKTWWDDYRKEHPAFVGGASSSGSSGASGSNVDEATVKAGLESLRSMGFGDDEGRATELLKRYGGNVERIVDVIIQEREKTYT